jgi:hypothetical protein
MSTEEILDEDRQRPDKNRARTAREREPALRIVNGTSAHRVCD